MLLSAHGHRSTSQAGVIDLRSGTVTRFRAFGYGSRCWSTVAVLVMIMAVSQVSTVAASADDPVRPVFSPPVDAPVFDPFRAPENPYGPGNRGIEYDTRPGEVVRSGAAGTVSFAGAVAGSLFVTLDHGGGVLSSYSYLERISVTEGSHVARGMPVGITGVKRFHFSVRINGDYVDPQNFAAIPKVRVRLLPWWR